MRASPGETAHMVGSTGPGDDATTPPSRAEAVIADAGRRQTGSARPWSSPRTGMGHCTRRSARPGPNPTKPSAWRSCRMTISLLREPEAPDLDALLMKSGLPPRLERRGGSSKIMSRASRSAACSSQGSEIVIRHDRLPLGLVCFDPDRAEASRAVTHARTR